MRPISVGVCPLAFPPRRNDGVEIVSVLAVTLSGIGESWRLIFGVAFPQHLPKKMPFGAKMRRDAVTSSTLITVLAPAFRF
jgi:hypothetical protein